MKHHLIVFLIATTTLSLSATEPNSEMEVRKVIQSFYAAFNSHDFSRAQDFTTEDWTHINPLGGLTRGREAVLKELKEVHSTFLKGVTDTPQEMHVKIVASGVAVATVPSKMSVFTTPDGNKRQNQSVIRTFVVVQRAGRWMILQDHNTFRSL